MTSASLSSTSLSAQRVFVLDVEGTNQPAHIVALASESIATALQRVGARVVTSADLKALGDLQRARKALDCGEPELCVAKIAEKSSAEAVVAATIGQVGGAFTLSIALYRRPFGVGSRAAETFDDASGIDGAARSIIAELVGGAPARARYKLPSGDGRPVSFAVLPLDATGVDEKLTRNVTEILAVELRRVEGASVVALDDVLRILELEQGRTALRCVADKECIAQIGDALGVDKLVVGQVGVLGDSYVVGARLIDRAEARVDNRVCETFVAGEAQLIPAARHVVRELLGINAGVYGTLHIGVSEAGARVSVDGVARGVAPLPPLALSAGRHHLRVDADGFVTSSSDIYVEPGATAAHWVALEEKPLLIRPFLPLAGFVSLAAATGALALGAVTAGSIGLWSQGDAASYAASDNVDGAEVNARNARTAGIVTVTNALWVSAGIAGAATLLSTLFVTWPET